jgi:tetratricopeptide (TPR) repeat protein
MKKKSKKTDKSCNTAEERALPVSSESSIWRSSADNRLVHIACLVLLIVIVYSNTLNAPFQWDEWGFIVNNPIVKNLHYFTSPSDAARLPRYSSFITRYVGYLTFALNYRIHGFSVAGYHMINIAIHIANSVLVYLIVLLTFRTPFFTIQDLRFTSHDSRPLIAFFSAVLFAVHPLQTEAVTYVFQRFASLVAFFYLLSLTAYIRSRTSDAGRQRIFYYSVSFLAAVLAMKTKENAFTLPLVITLYEFCFFTGSVKKRMLYLAPILFTLGIIPLTIMSLAGLPQINTGTFITFSRSDYFLTQIRVIVTYLRLLFFPVAQNLDYDYPVFKSFFDPQVLLSFIFLAAVFAFGVYLIIGNRQWAIGNGIKAKDKEDDSRFTSRSTQNAVRSRLLSAERRTLNSGRLTGFGILWFFITLSVESSIIPLPMLIDEYRVYLPSAGVAMSLVAGAFMLKERLRSPKSKMVLASMFALMLAVLSVATYLRNEVWGDRVRLWEDTARKAPFKESVYFHLGNAYNDHNMFDEAVAQYLTAIKIQPDYVDAHYNLGNVYRSLNMFDKAIEQYLIAIKLKPDYAEAYDNLGSIYRGNNMPGKAIEQYLIAITWQPDDENAHYNLGNVYRSLNMFDKATEQYLIAIKLKPDDAEAYNNLGLAYKSLNMFDKAIEQYLIAIKLKSDYVDAHNNLGNVYKSLNMFDKALEQYLIAVKLKPEGAETQYNLGILYEDSNMPDKAIEHYLIAIRLKPDFVEAHFNLGFIYYKTGQMEKARSEFRSELKINPGDQLARQLLEKISVKRNGS